MVIEDVVNDLTWIDEAFSKDYVDVLEAACCLTDGQNRVYFGDKVSGYSVDYEVHPNLRRNYRVITTWNFPRRCLFDFINKAIVKNLQNFRREVLLEKCEELFLSMLIADQEKFISNYDYICQELGLKNNTDDCKSNFELSETIKPWVPAAREIYRDLLPTKKHLSLDQISKLIHKEMQKRFSDGDKKMAKRGGKSVPDAGTIARYALQNLD